jgi:hypothetical protein
MKYHSGALNEELSESFRVKEEEKAQGNRPEVRWYRVLASLCRALFICLGGKS